MTANEQPPPELSPSAALFLDFDGTLAPIAQRPQDVRVPSWVVPVLDRLRDKLDGALAIVSGRPIAQVDAFLHPLTLAAAGAHGAERRDAAGRTESMPAEPPAEVVACARDLASRHAGLIVEVKPSGLALHYRARPELAQTCRVALFEAWSGSRTAQAWEWLNGHCVFELKQVGVSKGLALRRFLAEPPFAGRAPVFVGDDVTDEDGIDAAQAAGGFGVRVGRGRTLARFRLADVEAVAQWLETAAPSARTLDSKAHRT